MPQVAALEADLVDKMVWAPVGDDESRAGCAVWLDDKERTLSGSNCCRTTSTRRRRRSRACLIGAWPCRRPRSGC